MGHARGSAKNATNNSLHLRFKHIKVAEHSFSTVARYSLKAGVDFENKANMAKISFSSLRWSRKWGVNSLSLRENPSEEPSKRLRRRIRSKFETDSCWLFSHYLSP